MLVHECVCACVFVHMCVYARACMVHGVCVFGFGMYRLHIE